MSTSALEAVKLTSIQLTDHMTAAPRASARKRKRQKQPEDEIDSTSAGKKQRAYQVHTKERALEAASWEEVDPINYWIKEGSCPGILRTERSD